MFSAQFSVPAQSDAYASTAVAATVAAAAATAALFVGWFVNSISVPAVKNRTSYFLPRHIKLTRARPNSRPAAEEQLSDSYLSLSRSVRPCSAIRVERLRSEWKKNRRNRKKRHFPSLIAFVFVFRSFLRSFVPISFFLAP